MTDTRKALEMAIGELVLSKMISRNEIPVSRCVITADEINACKEALESQERPNNMVLLPQDKLIEMQEKIRRYESQEQEPVDWEKELREWNDCTGALPKNGSWFWEVVSMLERASNTHPAQPLSEQRIKDIWTSWMLMGNDPVKFARAIEKAHGIGE